jgi:hypothetical protein
MLTPEKLAEIQTIVKLISGSTPSAKRVQTVYEDNLTELAAPGTLASREVANAPRNLKIGF